MDLSKYIGLKLKSAGISVLLQKQNDDKYPNRIFNTFDRIGVLDTIILNDESLTNGLMKLRNRDTTITEAIHLSDVPGYFF